MQACIESPANTEAVQVFSLAETKANAFELYNFFLQTQHFKPYDDNSIDRVLPDAQPPEELIESLAQNDPLNQLSQCGPDLVTALNDSETVHDALDTFLAIEHIRTIDKNLRTSLQEPGQVLENSGAARLKELARCEDDAVSLKALRLLCIRMVSGHYLSIGSLCPDFAGTYVPLIKAHAKKTTEGARLYQDVLEALKPLDDERHHFLARAALKGMGFRDEEMRATWSKATSPKKVAAFTRNSLLTMFALEEQQAGLALNIYAAFDIRNFGDHLPETLKAIYEYRRARLSDDPQVRASVPAKYVLSLVDRAPNDSALHTPELTAALHKELAGKGIGFEIAECGSAEEVREVAVGAARQAARYGSRISDIDVNTHADPDALYIGQFERTRISTSNADVFAGFKEACTDDARIILNACSTGDNSKGVPIAQSVANASQLTVIAATGPIGLASYKVSAEGRLNTRWVGFRKWSSRFIPTKFFGLRRTFTPEDLQSPGTRAVDNIDTAIANLLEYAV